MERRISGSACFRILFTTLAGISSIKAAASSAYSSSTTSFSSLSEKVRISSSCSSGSISTKVSAASSLGSRRNSKGSLASSIEVKIAAISAGFMVSKISRRVAYFFSSAICAMAFSIISNRSCNLGFLLHLKVKPSPGKPRQNTGKRLLKLGTSAGYTARIHGVSPFVHSYIHSIPKGPICQSFGVHKNVAFYLQSLHHLFKTSLYANSVRMILATQ